MRSYTMDEQGFYGTKCENGILGMVIILYILSCYCQHFFSNPGK